MATPPSAVRSDLIVLTDEAKADVRAVAAAAPEDPAVVRAALFAAAPLIVTEYATAASVLAIDWFEELRDEAGITTPFQPQPFVTVTDDEIAAIVAQATQSLYDLQRGIEQEIQEAFDQSVAALEAELADEVARGFRDTIIENAEKDPEAVGWQRFARPGACKFCLMLAARGAVYTEATARFAAHGAATNGKITGGDCRCVAGPSWDPNAPKASVMQYTASQSTRTAKERAALRRYLNQNFPDAPG